jgi:hypothetical protein
MKRPLESSKNKAKQLWSNIAIENSNKVKWNLIENYVIMLK